MNTDTYSPQAAVLGSLLISPELTGEVLTQERLTREPIP